MVEIKECAFNSNDYDHMFKEFTPLEMSDFQKWACMAVADGNHVLITAPTGSGKTLPAEFMISLQLRKPVLERKRIIYASPIKALSNQKLHDIRARFPDASVGLLTGDCKENPEADILVMTTEILRNTLFNQRLQKENGQDLKVPLSFEMNIETELGGVIFDEVHYIADPERGSVWEQSLMMIPPHVPLVLLSATIHKPELFAKWVERRHGDLSTKTVYLTPAAKRVVPLTHYTWTLLPKKCIDSIRDKEIKTIANTLVEEPLILRTASGDFQDKVYYPTNKVCSYVRRNYMTPKRQFVLNALVSHLRDKQLLPALCFIFSRKQVEAAAREITVPLHDDNGVSANTVEKVCEKILMSKISNYKEYTALTEYKQLISLLEKGVAIHHAGMLTVLREMVEMLFDRGFIKLLFATETFAVGINMPTKTVIFTSLEKYDGNGTRLLRPHEYAQMAGRAGRRGIDTQGTVIHCNGLYETPSIGDYRHMLTGPPQAIYSRFAVSYHFVLNVLMTSTGNIASVINFVSNSLLSADIRSEINAIDNKTKDLEKSLTSLNDICSHLRTPRCECERWLDITSNLNTGSNKVRKKHQKDLAKIESEYPSIKKDSKIVSDALNVATQVEDANTDKNRATNYVDRCVKSVIELLETAGLVHTQSDGVIEVTSTGKIASQIQEIDPVVLAMTMMACDGFQDLDSPSLAGLLAALTPVNIPEDQRAIHPATGNNTLDTASIEMEKSASRLSALEDRFETYSTNDHTVRFDTQRSIIDWYNATDETSCMNIARESGQSLGDFVKNILKICNAVRELKDAVEMLGYTPLAAKLSEIPDNLLKSVASSQSLYI